MRWLGVSGELRSAKLISHTQADAATASRRQIGAGRAGGAVNSRGDYGLHRGREEN